MAALADILTQVGLKLTGVTSLIGPEHILVHSAPPRVVWVPARERIEPTDNLDADPRQYATRAAGVEVHVWGADYGATEDLINKVVAAIHSGASLWGAYRFGERAGWLALEGRWTALGRCYVFTVEFFIPIVDPPYTTGTVASIPQTGVLVKGAPPTDSAG